MRTFHSPGREIEEMEGALGVGDVLEANRGIALGAEHGDQDAGHGQARAALDQRSREVLDRRWRGLRLDRGRSAAARAPGAWAPGR
jgi:hypothetical protein